MAAPKLRASRALRDSSSGGEGARRTRRGCLGCDAFVCSGSWAAQWTRARRGSDGQQQQPVADKQSKRDKQQEADSGTGKNGHEDEVTKYEQELAGYLQERIKPGLNSGAIPLLARSIAKEIAHREHPNGSSEEAHRRRGDDERSADSEAPDFEADMRELQAELGEDWILRFSVQGDNAWLTAEKDDGSQRVEAPTAAVISEAVELLNADGGRST